MYLIFDFDGTLIDSFHCVIEKFNLLAATFNFRKVGFHEIDDLRDLSSQDVLKHFCIPLYKIPAVLHLARKYLHDEILTLTPFTDISALLYDLNKAGFNLGIVTSNSRENVVSWLQHHEINDLFDFIYTSSSFFGKKNILKKALKQNNIQKYDALYIGDETRDILAAKQCGIYSIAVTWGFNSQKILSQYHPDYLAHCPNDILTIGLELNKKSRV